MPGPEVEPPKEPASVGYVTVHMPEYADDSSGEPIFSVQSSAWFGTPGTPGKGISDCELVENKLDDSSPAEPDPASDNAGTIDVEVTTGAEKSTLSLPFDDKEKQYEPTAAAAKGPAAGMIHVRARGGVVPAFSVDLVSQSPVGIVSPAARSKVGARDLSISWTADPEADFVLVMLGSFEKEVRCAVTQGNVVTVPAALMKSVLDDERSNAIGLTLYAGKSTKLDVGDYRVHVQHSTSVMTTLLKE